MAAAVGMLMLAGCTGGGAVHTVPLMRSDFQPGEPPIEFVPVTEAYYWTGEDGSLNIALRYRAPSLLGRAFDTEWLMSIVLDGLPAGSGKLYEMKSREIRMLQSHAGDHRRGQSVRGVAVIEASRHGRLIGRFHAWMRQQRFAVLTGWAPPLNRAPLLISAGRFEAVRDPQAGSRILARTEQDGFERAGASPPTSQPIRWLSSVPSSAPGP